MSDATNRDAGDSSRSMEPQDSLPLASVVKLWIPIDWWWWSGYPRYPGIPNCLAKTDGPKFYDEHAFPSLKPDIDVFGCPCRSRKQRGWYQVVAPYLGPIDTPRDNHHRALAQASDIPPELFQNILQQPPWVESSKFKMAGEFQWVSCVYDKRGLGRFGSVAWYWAKICQARLFHLVELRSREDVLQLLEFIKPPTNAVSRIVKEVVIKSTARKASDYPWIHRISAINGELTRRNGNPCAVFLRLEGPLPPGQKTLRSIHDGLPRSLPHFSGHIKSLLLKNFHFAKLGDLMHLVWEMPHLQGLKCLKVTWGSLSITTLRRKSCAGWRPDSGVLVEMDERCGPSPAEACVWLITCLVHKADSFLSSDGLARVLTVSRAVNHTTDGVLPARIQVSVDRYALNAFDMSVRDNLNNAVYKMFVFDEVRPPRQHLPQDDPYIWSTAYVQIKARKRQGLSDTEAKSVWMDQCDWNTIGKIPTSSDHPLNEVVVLFESQEDRALFEEEVVKTHMSHLHSSHRKDFFDLELRAPSVPSPRRFRNS